MLDAFQLYIKDVRSSDFHNEQEHDWNKVFDRTLITSVLFTWY